MEANTDRMESFRALALQVTCHAVNHVRNRTEARALMEQAIKHLDPQIAASRAFIGADCRLVVLPEYWLTGFPMGEPVAVWADKAVLKVKIRKVGV